MASDKKIKREQIQMPLDLLDQVLEYKERNHITTKNAAYLELIRKGLAADREERQKGQA